MLDDCSEFLRARGENQFCLWWLAGRKMSVLQKYVKSVVAFNAMPCCLIMTEPSTKPAADSCGTLRAVIHHVTSIHLDGSVSYLRRYCTLYSNFPWAGAVVLVLHETFRYLHTILRRYVPSYQVCATEVIRLPCTKVPSTANLTTNFTERYLHFAFLLRACRSCTTQQNPPQLDVASGRHARSSNRRRREY
jgi:hypothetical protein